MTENKDVKEPLSFSTNDMYVQCFTDIAKHIGLELTESKTLKVSFDIPVSDVKKFVIGAGDGDLPNTTDLKCSAIKNRINAYNRTVDDNRRDGPVIIDFMTGKRI